MEASFDLDSLLWHKLPNVRGAGAKLQAKFPWSHLEAFIVSEQTKGFCTFTTEKRMKATTIDELLTGDDRQIRCNTPLFYCTWRCAFGGHAKLCRAGKSVAAEEPPQSAPEGKRRRSKSANGESIKEPGCMCRWVHVWVGSCLGVQ